MSFLTSIIKELRERKLWPIAVGLIVALVAVPVLLSKKAPTNLITPEAGAGLPYSTGSTLPAISIKTVPGNSKLPGKGRNPFTPYHIGSTTTATTASASTTTTSGSTSTTGSSSGTTGTGSTSGGSSTATTPATTSTPAATTPSPAPTTPPKPAPAGLTATQSYEVSLAITTPGGGLNTIDPLQRLSILPNQKQPLLLELGVLQGGKQVVFAVEPGAVVSGPGACTPGPIDCEILTLSPGQTEGVSQQTSTGSTPVALFAVNSISAANHPSVAAANQARHDASQAGRELLANSPLGAASLFQYDPSVGAVVDLRNLTVGGS
ncbi:MAG TPA: hypothetical protein VMA77_06250 [Solirubrobacteraceae bacterium]|nr:hypothetical protein [Solirubrobacteraceae bacterium]